MGHIGSHMQGPMGRVVGQHRAQGAQGSADQPGILPQIRAQGAQGSLDQAGILAYKGPKGLSAPESARNIGSESQKW